MMLEQGSQRTTNPASHDDLFLYAAAPQAHHQSSRLIGLRRVTTPSFEDAKHEQPPTTFIRANEVAPLVPPFWVDSPVFSPHSLQTGPSQSPLDGLDAFAHSSPQTFTALVNNELHCTSSFEVIIHNKADKRGG
jgi:hypothetical protein